MDVIGGIAAATEGLKLVNELRKIDREVDKAELKLRLVEVADKLLDSKQALQEAQERAFELQKRISALEEQLAQKSRLKDERGLLYEVDEHGDHIDEPYCNQCYVKVEKPFRLVSDNFAGGFGYKCHNCEKVYFITRNRGSLRSLRDLGEDLG
jgi:hypothetical protein